MPKFEVEVRRTAWGFRTIEVEAKNKLDAEQKALDIAGDFEYSEKSSEYETMSVTPKEKEDGKGS